MFKHKFFIALFAVLLSSTLFTSCLSKEDEPKTIDNPDNIEIDTDYKASLTEMQGSWQGEYSGYDANQKANTNIRRKLTLKSNGTYENRIQGILVKQKDKNEYTTFEVETGTFQYNGKDKITFYVKGDSLINYKTETLEYFTKKHAYSGSDDNSKDVSVYSEGVRFQTKDSKHYWVTKDVYLSNLKGEDLELYFLMNKE